MTTLKETAQAYEPKQTLNIADLDRVDISFPIEERTGNDMEGKEFKYKAMIVNGIDYRVPNTVLEELKKMIQLKPEIKFVKVNKQGLGLATRYSVSLLE